MRNSINVAFLCVESSANFPSRMTDAGRVAAAGGGMRQANEPLPGASRLNAGKSSVPIDARKVMALNENQFFFSLKITEKY